MKSPLVSVIVTTYNSSKCLPACLESIQDQSYEPIELIVVDNHSRDNSKAIAEKYSNKVYSRGPERSAQRNFGVKESQGDYVLIIDSDMELSKDVVKSCVETMLATRSRQALIIPEESFGEGFWTECKKLERSFYQGIDWQEAPRFFDRKVYQELGGYDEKLTGWEDYDLPNRIEYKYGQESVGRVAEIIYHNEEKLSLIKTCQKKFYYAATLSIYINKDENQKRLVKQTSILRRYWLFVSHPGKLFNNPILGIGMLFMKTCELGAGGAGFLYAKLLNPARRSEAS